MFHGLGLRRIGVSRKSRVAASCAMGFTKEQEQESRNALEAIFWFLMREFSVPWQRVHNLDETMVMMLPSHSKCWTYRGSAGKTTFPGDKIGCTVTVVLPAI
eukprot:6478208-Amphidinium_carterae.1